ncbi:PASTA domain-containing protein [Streptomyces sp. NPDC008141]|uniref:PASTA domain-containing protein n=1 Tax=Streptomyces sp. NPDC008141 TaxID=3364815 RepID=UPI0036E2F07A
MTWNQQPTAPYQAVAPAPKPGWARKRVVIPSAVGLFFFGVVVGSAGGETRTTTTAANPAPTVTATVTAKAAEPPVAEPPAAKTAAPKTAAPKTTAPKPAVASPDAKAPADERARVLDFVGMGLQEAQDSAQAVGFFFLTSHDSTGAGRMQVFDRNWKVCSQSVAAGRTVDVGTELDFGTVKLSESCP